MCDICNNIICPSACPNYYESEDEGSRDNYFGEYESKAGLMPGAHPLAVCECCQEELYAGQSCVSIGEYTLCLRCIEDNTVVLCRQAPEFHNAKL